MLGCLLVGRVTLLASSTPLLPSVLMELALLPRRELPALLSTALLPLERLGSCSLRYSIMNESRM